MKRANEGDAYTLRTNVGIGGQPVTGQGMTIIGRLIAVVLVSGANRNTITRMNNTNAAIIALL
ncbi:MAG: hypothetical protein ACYC7D_15440 [Nitrososphaerales archaeon]